jgi:hypothetical protein
VALVRQVTGARALNTQLRPRASWHGWALSLCALLVISLPVGAVAPASEYRIKAVFLFNFAQFVEWPPDAFADSGKPFVIGILGKDPFGAELDSVVQGETVAQRPLVIERYHSIVDLRDCNILYIARAEMDHLAEVLTALKGRSILTVSDADGDDQTGVMIRLVNRSDHIRLQIDVGAARAGRLTISSKLLRPAEIVGGAEGQP